jgi:tRNA dimethylallyltransferase
MATPIVDDILARGRLPIVAGGTGLYIDHLLAGRTFAPYEEDGQLRAALQRRAAEEGLDGLRAQLRQVDPESAARLHPNDEKRILRALEVFLSTGKPLSQHNRDSQNLPPRYRALTLRLDFAHRATLWQRIDRRVDEMMERGLEGEVRSLLDSGLDSGCTAMQAIGYKELAAALRSGLPLAPAVEEVKLRSRQYSKRQRTWFARNREARLLLWENIPDISAAVEISTQLAMEAGVR